MVTELRHKKFEDLTVEERKTVFLHLNILGIDIEKTWTETEKKVDKYYLESLGATKEAI